MVWFAMGPQILGFHLTSQPFPNMGIRHSCVPRSAKFMVIVSHIYRPLLVFVDFFASIMDLAEAKAEEDLKTLPLIFLCCQSTLKL